MSLYNSQNNTVNIPHQYIGEDDYSEDSGTDIEWYYRAENSSHIPFKDNTIHSIDVFSNITVHSSFKPHHIIHLDNYLRYNHARGYDNYHVPDSMYRITSVKCFVPTVLRPGNVLPYHDIGKVVKINKNILKNKPHALCSYFYHYLQTGSDVRDHDKYDFYKNNDVQISTMHNSFRNVHSEFTSQNRTRNYQIYHSISSMDTIPYDSDSDDESPCSYTDKSTVVNPFMQVIGKVLPIRAAFHSSFKYVGLHSLKALCLSINCVISESKPISVNTNRLKLLADRGIIPRDIVSDLSEYAVCSMCSSFPVPSTKDCLTSDVLSTNAFAAMDSENSHKDSDYICICCTSRKYFHIDYSDAKNVSHLVTNYQEEFQESLNIANWRKEEYKVYFQQHFYMNILFDKISNDHLRPMSSYVSIHTVLSLLLAQYISGECFLCMTSMDIIPRMYTEFEHIIEGIRSKSDRSYMIYKLVRALMPNLHSILVNDFMFYFTAFGRYEVNNSSCCSHGKIGDLLQYEYKVSGRSRGIPLSFIDDTIRNGDPNIDINLRNHINHIITQAILYHAYSKYARVYYVHAGNRYQVQKKGHTYTTREGIMYKYKA